MFREPSPESHGVALPCGGSRSALEGEQLPGVAVPPAFSWTPELEARLLAFRYTGKPASEIARELRISRSAVLGKLWRMRGNGDHRVRHRRPSSPSVARKPVTIAGLRADTCRWPLWQAEDVERFYCGDPVKTLGKPYCCHHAGISQGRARFQEGEQETPNYRHGRLWLLASENTEE